MAVRDEDRALELLGLIGERAVVLHGPGGEDGLAGRDLDCLVDGIDLLWPLRLSDGWRLSNWTRYDLRAWYWVLERAGRFVAIDTSDDPDGFCRDAVRTSWFLGRLEDGERSDPLHAAYLTVKRLRKGVADPEAWAAIGRVASVDPARFEAELELVAGQPYASLMAPIALSGTVPSPSIARRANRIRWLRRFGSPGRAARALSLGARRYAERLAHPPGLSVLVVGPDGAGKSTLADALPALCAPMFRRHVRSHWRPGILPRPGAMLGRSPGDPTQPHARQPHGVVPSALLLGYYWADFCLGAVIRDLPGRIRTGMIVRERGWWDLAVDPTRYRLRVAPGPVRWLGALLPRPDLVVVLEGAAELLYARKPELGREELERQRVAWRSVIPASVRSVRIDVGRSAEEVAARASEAVTRVMEARAVSRLGLGWVALPGGSTRWWLPRSPRAAARASVSVYHPVTARALAGWTLARGLGGAGAFRLLPRGSAPPRAVREVLAPHVPRRGTMAVARATHPHRFVALLLDHRGSPGALAKVALDTEGVRALRDEERALRRYAGLLSSPLAAPQMLHAETGLLLLEPVDWVARRSAWRLDEDVAGALGEFFRAGEGGKGLGAAHGDCAPWNLLRTRHGWTLVDWESARPAPAFHDVCHHVVQTHALLGVPSASGLIHGFRDGDGWVGRAVGAYAEAAGLSAESGLEALTIYLRDIVTVETARTSAERRGLGRRRRLLARLEA